MNLGITIRLQEYLSQIPIELAQTIALENNLQCNLYSKARLIETLTRTFRDRRFLKKLFNQLNDMQTAGIMMTLFFAGEEPATADHYYQELHKLFPESTTAPDAIMNSLCQRGLIYSALIDEERTTYAIPVDLAELLLEIIGQDLLEKLDYLPEPPRTRRFDGLAIIRDIFTFLAFLKRDNVKLTQEFVIFKRTQLRIMDSFELPEQPVEDPEKEDETGSYPPRFDFIYRFCDAKGLTKIEGNYLRITEVVEEWLGKPDFAKMREIFDFWQERYMASIAEAQLILRLLILVRDEQWLSSESVTRVFDVLMPEQKWFQQKSQTRDPNFLNVLLYIGGIEQGLPYEQPETHFGIRISTLGKAILTNDISLFPKQVERHFTIRPNFEAVASKDLDPSIRWELGKIAELVRINNEITYKLSRQSIYHTLQEGKTVEDIMGFLDGHATKPFPDNVRDTIAEWTSTYGRISFVDALLLRCDTFTLAKELKDSKKISKFLVEQIAPTYFIIRRKDHQKLVEALEEEDYMPKPEIEKFPLPTPTSPPPSTSGSKKSA